MTTADPNDELFAQMEAQLADVEEPTDVENVQEVPDLDLQERLNELDARLSKMGELMQPRTQEGRDLHSQRVALLIELRRRRLR